MDISAKPTVWNLLCVARGGRLDYVLRAEIDSVLDNSGSGTARAKVAQETPAQSHTSPSILVSEEKHTVWLHLEVLHCDPKGSRAFLRILSTKGRGVRLWWAL